MESCRVAVIGAGAAGIATARRLKEKKMNFTVFEKSDSVGGTWVYDERVGNDEHGEPIHTSMYLNLWTNLPKEIMGFPDLPIEAEGQSYVPAATILQYLKDYAEHFNVIENIKLKTKVENVHRKGEKWILNIKHVENNITFKEEFDVVIVCNGHYHTPNLPYFNGSETFLGKIMHSHDYRKSEDYEGQSVVIVGAGPSGLDIAFDVAVSAKQVYLSHHLKDEISTQLPKNFTIKPDISHLSANEIIFVDGTQAQADVLLYCTGYKYNFPFLDESCGITVQDNYIYPLYKHVIAIKNPTLLFIGLPFYVCANAMFDLQARFVVENLIGNFKLPSEKEMLEDEAEEVAQRRCLGFSLRESHKMGPLQGQYYDMLAETAGIPGIAPVMTLVHNYSSERFLEDLHNFRKDRFELINDFEYRELEPMAELNRFKN